MTELDRAPNIVLAVIITLAVGAAFLLLGRTLHRGTGKRNWLLRVPLAVLWLISYALLVMLITFLLRGLSIDDRTLIAVGNLLILVGAVAMILQLVNWSRAARGTAVAASAAMPVLTRPARPVATLSTFLRCAYEGLALPIRRPILFVPFVFYMLVFALALQAVGLRLETIDTIDEPETFALLGLITLAVLPVFILALELTSHMAAEAELGRPIQLSTSLGRAVRRLPRSLAVNLLYALGLAVGVLLLIVPFIVWAVRWHLVTQAVMLGNAGVREAFRISDGVTRGRWWRFALLLLLVGAGQAGLRALLARVPNAGILLSGWVDFAWLTIAMTLAYIRTGAPVD
jgi:hypothetical protein